MFKFASCWASLAYEIVLFLWIWKAFTQEKMQRRFHGVFFIKVSRRLKVYCLQAAYNRCFDFNISFRIIWRPYYRHKNRIMLVNLLKLRLHTFARFLNRLRVVMYLVWVADMWTVVTQIPHTIPVGVYLVSSSFQFDTLVNGIPNPYNAFWKHVSDL